MYHGKPQVMRTIDVAATRARGFQDKRSRVRTDGREVLYKKDWEQRCCEVVIRDLGICQICHKRVEDWQAGDVHHIISRHESRDDRMTNLQLVHRKCHEDLHPTKQVRWTRGQTDPR
jgi:5-methylcytosine-specific restriction endonuclease McrA